VRYEFRNEANNLISDYRIVNQIVYRFLSFIQEFPSPVCRDILNITPAKDRGKLLDWEGGVKEKMNLFLPLFIKASADLVILIVSMVNCLWYRLCITFFILITDICDELVKRSLEVYAYRKFQMA